MPQYDFDLFTIGAGSGGVASSRRAGSYGARVAICEEDRVGGTCVLRGCVPKKLLVYGAHFRHDFEDAAGFGWSVPESEAFDWKKLQAAKDKELDRLNGVYKRLLRDSGVQLIEGRGRIVDPHTVEVAGQRYTAAHILVSTGSRPFLPEMPGNEHVITSDGALTLQGAAAPDHHRRRWLHRRGVRGHLQRPGRQGVDAHPRRHSAARLRR